jgi:L-ascorbate metabolism protein UlaG (beta-lactamase superfamily)
MTTNYQNDKVTTRNGEELSITFLGHASLAMQCAGKTIYIDPVGMFADYSGAPKADVILVTHHHSDHLDPDTVALLSKPSTEIIATDTVISALGKGIVMNNGDRMMLGDTLTIEAMPAYNTTPGRDVFHPKGQNNGYLLTLCGTRIYVAGDTEPTPEMLALKDIDIAFLPVNQPYTMTIEQAVETAKAIRPAIFYPYHYGRTDQKTDIERVAELLEGTGIDVRIRDME